MNWNQDQLPETVVYNGLEIPVYLDAESIQALDADTYLCNQANWLIHIGKHSGRTPPSLESQEVKAMLGALEKARKIYGSLSTTSKHGSLSTTNKHRIDAQKLDQLIDEVRYCHETPLPKKRKYENLYHTFNTIGAAQWRKVGSYGDPPTEFELFMAVVIRHIENGDGANIEKYVARVRKTYKERIDWDKTPKYI
jgi:hypothetical protein